MTYNIRNDLYALLADEPFLARCMLSIERRAEDKIPTAAIGFDQVNSRFAMYYNPEFMEKLSVKHRRGVILHELFHFINEHVTTRFPNPKYGKIWNFATDLAINSHIEDRLPEFCLVPGRGPFEDTDKWVPKQTADFYFDILKKEQDEVEEKIKEWLEEHKDELENGDGSGNSFMDDHSTWDELDEGEGSGVTNEIAKLKAKEILREGVKKASQKSNGWGTISQEMKDRIIKGLTPTVDWRSLLRSFVKASQRCNKTKTIMKVNKRKPYQRPGSRQAHVANIAISIDMSGSVSDELLASFFTELDALSKLATFTVIPFDHEVLEEEIYTWEKGSRRDPVRVLCGGTNFDAPTKYVNEQKKFDGHIVLTDLCAPQPESSRSRRMWMTNEENAAHMYINPNDFGERLVIIK